MYPLPPLRGDMPEGRAEVLDDVFPLSTAGLVQFCRFWLMLGAYYPSRGGAHWITSKPARSYASGARKRASPSGSWPRGCTSRTGPYQSGNAAFHAVKDTQPAVIKQITGSYQLEPTFYSH